MRANMSDYRSLMSDVELPDRVRQSIECEANRLRNGHGERLQECAPARHRRRRIRKMTLGGGLAAGACAAALTIALFLSGGTNLLDGPSALSAPTGISSGNSFALVAYAAENPEREPEDTVALDLDFLGCDIAFSPLACDPETDPASSDGSAEGEQQFSYCERSFNLTCTGENVKTITYRIEGERVHFTTVETLVNGEGAPSQNDEFTVDYDKQSSDATGMYRSIRASFPLDDELSAAYEQMQQYLSGNGEPTEEMRTAVEYLKYTVERAYADVLAQSRLVLTATYNDGTSQTKAYAITPVENFDAEYLAYQEAIHQELKALQKGESPQSIPSPSLYVLAEIAE